MTSTTSSPGPIEKVSSDNIVVAFDLLSNLTYMSSLSAAHSSRELTLRKAGERARLKTAVIFQHVHLLAQRLGLEYVQALQLVAEKAKAKSIKSLLLRFASTMASGESEQEFIREETRVEGVRYANQYERSIENLRKWTDAYAALLVSVSLIVVVALVSTLMGAIEQSFVLIIGAVMFLIPAGGVYVILRSAPYEQITYEGESLGPPDRRTARTLLRTLGLIGVMAGLLAAYLFGVGEGLLIFGLFILPAGYFATRDDGKVTAIDKEVATFIRALGNIAGATGTTLASALRKLDLESMGSLAPDVVRLRDRLGSELPTELCWERFKEETGSELLKRSTEMLVDGVEAGGRAEEIGDIAATYASTVSELRETRRLTSSSFSFLVIPMHAAMTGLLLFILEIISSFNSRLSDAALGLTDISAEATVALNRSGGLSMFEAQDLTLISAMIAMVVVTLTVSNALASKAAAGGNNLKIRFSLGIMSVISGATMIMVPKIANSVFGV